jgi:hypothetical protein
MTLIISEFTTNKHQNQNQKPRGLQVTALLTQWWCAPMVMFVFNSSTMSAMVMSAESWRWVLVPGDECKKVQKGIAIEGGSKRSVKQTKVARTHVRPQPR